ncbi:MAG: VanW family protein [Lachnospiraceae bacterium]|jgi:vancomycin resistance protein YoaR|nr:VanW family protein [Lachnospiraceae bacterium]
MAGKGRRSKTSKQSGKRNLIKNLVLVLVVMAVVFGVGLSVAASSYQNRYIFAPGTTLDGQNIGGMTVDEAKKAIDERHKSDAVNKKIDLEFDGTLTELDQSALGIKYDTASMLAQIMEDDKAKNSFLDNVAKVLGLSGKPSYETKPIYDKEHLITVLKSALSEKEKPATDAKAVMDEKTGEFKYIEGESGITADVESIVDAVLNYVKKGETATVQVATQVQAPSITVEDIKQNIALVSEYTTNLTDETNRNTNIKLICDAVDGYTIAPGATLSLNELVGQRTTEKGYVMAAAILDGKVEDDLGGGICQLAGTLYNAALMADMEIVERVKHTYPADYLPVGLDASLNWNNQDLKIKNVSDYPILIDSNMDLTEHTLTVKLYGQPIADNIKIEINPEVIKELKPQGEKIITTKDLAPGVRQVVDEASPGYEVVVYRKYYMNNEEIKSEEISHDTYGAKDATVKVGVSGATVK